MNSSLAQRRLHLPTATTLIPATAARTSEPMWLRVSREYGSAPLSVRAPKSAPSTWIPRPPFSRPRFPPRSTGSSHGCNRERIDESPPIRAPDEARLVARSASLFALHDSRVDEPLHRPLLRRPGYRRFPFEPGQ